MKNNIDLPSVQLSRDGKTLSGNSADHRATFTVHETKEGPFLHIIVPLKGTNAEGQPLTTKKGKPWHRAWLRAMGVNVALFTNEEGGTLMLSRNG